MRPVNGDGEVSRPVACLRFPVEHILARLIELRPRQVRLKGFAARLLYIARFRALEPDMLAVRIAVVSERFSVDVELRRGNLPVQNNRVRFRSVPCLVRHIEFVRSLIRQFRTRSVVHKLLPAGQFHEHAGERRFILCDKLDIRGIRRIAGVHRTLPAVQRSRGIRLIQRYRHRLRLIPRSVYGIERIRALRRELRIGGVAFKLGIARFLHVQPRNARTAVGRGVFYIFCVRERAAALRRLARIQNTDGLCLIQRDRHRSRLVSAAVGTIEGILSLCREFRAARIVRICRAARHLDVAICDSRQTICGDILHILRVRVCAARFYRRSAIERTRRQRAVERNRYGIRLVARKVAAVKLVPPFCRKLRAGGIAFKLGAARFLHI